ncbi:MAG: tRNA lysidine(34) synthetase TilS [Neisseria sp.]|uniref:tRNA lysidine(34) synthetase TilS n=1 Tax=Neisseria sp. TaxID=192066 RepID=UPI0026DCA5DD|nr:tRNA lysidine(34) synthetase TilS [Neisseria sp.]MDO4249383.1 tRNA lysidine(34) synthetase TilS [Neisseria sp.]
MVKDTDTLLKTVGASWLRAAGRPATVTVGLSGGLDSVVLLHVLARLQAECGFALSALYVHHGLLAEADEWLGFCQAYCASLEIPFYFEYVQVEKNGKGLEGAARQARYQAYERSAGDVIALAHHQNDQSETFMLGVLRGGGLRALAAMPEWRALALNGKQIWRPLLAVPRPVLQDYAAEHGLPYIEDPSNADNSLLRNWLRNEALPLWRERVPQLDEQLSAGVQLLQQQLAILDEVAKADALWLEEMGYFDCTRWRQLSPARQSQQLYDLARRKQLGVPSAASVADFQRVLLQIKPDVQAEWQLPFGKVYAYQNRLFALPQDWLGNCFWLDLQTMQDEKACLKEMAASGNIKLCWHKLGLREDVLEQKLLIRAVTTDDVIELTAGHKKVRKLLQECKIPPFVRSYWPVITDINNHCIAVANIWVSPSHACPDGVLPVFEQFNLFILEPK